MTNTEYIKNALRTNTGLKVNITAANEDLLHGVLGLTTETGELVDIVKRHLFYGEPLNMSHLKEEIGDKFWYLAVLCEWAGFTFEECMEVNIDKLHVRYPEKFSKDKALNRNLDAEKKCLSKQ